MEADKHLLDSIQSNEQKLLQENEELKEKLQAFYDAGIENWDGYNYALSLIDKLDNDQ